MEQMVGNIVLFGLLFFFIYFVMIRPNKRRQMEHQQLIDSLETGDEVMTTTGIFGTVTSVGDEELKLQIAPNTEIRLLKRAVATRVTEGLDDSTTVDERETENA